MPKKKNQTETIVEPLAEPTQMQVQDQEEHEEVAALLKKNLQWSNIIYEQNKRIQRRLTWMVVGSYLRLLIVVIPLIVAAVYLPPLLRDIMGSYQQVLGTSAGGSVDVSGIVSNLSPEQIAEALESLSQ